MIFPFIFQYVESNISSYEALYKGYNKALILTHWPLGHLTCDFKNVIFNLALQIGIFKSSNANILRWMPQDLTGDTSTLVQVMAWCRQATSHYLNQCWPRSPTPHDVTGPQWVCLIKYDTELTLYELSPVYNHSASILNSFWMEFTDKVRNQTLCMISR